MTKDDSNETVTDLILAGQYDKSDSSRLVEITAHIYEYQEFALEILENAERQRLGKDFDRSKLIQEALDLLIEKHIKVGRIRKSQFLRGQR